MNETVKGSNPQWHIDYKTLDGWTALMYASMNGFATLCELLVKEGGADINHTDKFHRTALHWACRFDGTIVCKRLLDLNAKTNLTDIEGLTPVDLAEKYRNKNVSQSVRSFLANKKLQAERKKNIQEAKEKAKKDKARVKKEAEQRENTLVK